MSLVQGVECEEGDGSTMAMLGEPAAGLHLLVDLEGEREKGQCSAEFSVHCLHPRRTPMVSARPTLLPLVAVCMHARNYAP